MTTKKATLAHRKRIRQCLAHLKSGQYSRIMCEYYKTAIRVSWQYRNGEGK